MQLEELDIQAVAEKVPERVRGIAALVGVVSLALLAARPGFIRIGEWWAASSAENYYYEYGYSAEALVWFCIAGIAAGLVISGWSRENVKLTLAGAVLGLIALLAQLITFDPDAPMQRGRQEMSVDLTALQSEITKLSRD